MPITKLQAALRTALKIMLQIMLRIFRALFSPAKARADERSNGEYVVVLTAASDDAAREAAGTKALKAALTNFLACRAPSEEQVREKILPQASELVESVRILDKVKKSGKFKYRVAVVVREDDLVGLALDARPPSLECAFEDYKKSVFNIFPPRDFHVRARVLQDRSVVRRLREAAETDDPDVLARLAADEPASGVMIGHLFLLGEKVEKDLDKARVILTGLAGLGAPRAEILLIAVHLERGELREAAELLKKASGNDDCYLPFLDCLVCEAVHLAYGSQGPVSRKKVLDAFEHALKHNSVESETYLALMYKHGHLVKKNPAKYLELVGAAAKTGYPPANHNLAVSLYFGYGAPADKLGAIRRAAVAAGRGSAQAQALLNFIYFREGCGGEELPPHNMYTFDDTEAMRFLLYLRAATMTRQGLGSSLDLMRDMDPEDDLGDYFKLSAFAPETRTAMRTGRRADKNDGADGPAGKTDDPDALVRRGLRRYRDGDWEAAAGIFERASDLGSPQAASYLASMCCRGLGVPRDYARAIKLYRRLLGLKGWPYDKHKLANMYLRGLGAPRDDDEAGRIFMLAAAETKMLFPPSLRALASINMTRNCREGPEEAAKFLETAALCGDVRAQLQLADLYNQSDDPELLARASDWYRTCSFLNWTMFLLPPGPPAGDFPADEAEEGAFPLPTRAEALAVAARGRFQSGLMSLEGRGAEQNFHFAYLNFRVAWDHCADLERGRAAGTGAAAGPALEDDIAELDSRLEAAAARNSDDGDYEASAEYLLSRLRELGRGVEKDPAESLRRLRSSAEKNNPQAQNRLGEKLRRGPDPEKNEAQAAVWFRRAAEQNQPDAQLALAEMLLEGQGAPRDPEEAVKWLLKASRNGRAEAMFALGNIYRDGQIVGRDNREARTWMRRAADAGHKPARETLERWSGAAL
ncbi:MAG: sel1 repeat family protein [Deltaproteobacteria bacterium]|jgi:TPR repeat protein|nr:sel1 repeat family protein [Deltaproteobacteria bacterium]